MFRRVGEAVRKCRKCLRSARQRGKKGHFPATLQETLARPEPLDVREPFTLQYVFYIHPLSQQRVVSGRLKVSRLGSIQGVPPGRASFRFSGVSFQDFFGLEGADGKWA